MMHQFRTHGVVPRELSFHEQMICMFDMVKYGHYICFVNEGAFLSLRDADPKLVARPMADPITFDIGFIMRKDIPLPKIGHELIDYIKNTSQYWLHVR